MECSLLINGMALYRVPAYAVRVLVIVGVALAVEFSQRENRFEIPRAHLLHGVIYLRVSGAKTSPPSLHFIWYCLGLNCAHDHGCSWWAHKKAPPALICHRIWPGRRLNGIQLFVHVAPWWLDEKLSLSSRNKLQGISRFSYFRPVNTPKPISIDLQHISLRLL